MSKGVEILKKAAITPNEAEQLSDFQMERAKHETGYAFKTIELHAQHISESEFQKFLQIRLSDITKLIAL